MSITYTNHVAFLKPESIGFTMEWIIQVLVPGVTKISHRIPIPTLYKQILV